jgi:type II secretory pathway component PulF
MNAIRPIKPEPRALRKQARSMANMAINDLCRDLSMMLAAGVVGEVYRSGDLQALQRVAERIRHVPREAIAQAVIAAMQQDGDGGA